MKILVLAPYPVLDGPAYGGPLRARALAKGYRALGHTVELIGVYPRALHADGARDTQSLDWPASLVERVRRDPKCEETVRLRDLPANLELVETLRTRVASFAPDIIQIEQPSLWPLAKAAGLPGRARLILSSHNVEAQMGESALTAGVERDLVAQAHLVLATTASDADHFRGQGARAVTYVPNGTDLLPDCEGTRTRWRARWAKYRAPARRAFFVSSAHAPNVAGFERFVSSPSPAWLAPGQEIIVAGGISHAFERGEGLGLFPGVARAKFVVTGPVADEDLGALMALSDAILLPIDAGGGSNLKTAQALLSGKPIVATPFAFRGFEAFRDTPLVTLCETPEAFRRATVAALAKPLSASLAYATRDTLKDQLVWDRFVPSRLEAALKELA